MERNTARGAVSSENPTLLDHEPLSMTNTRLDTKPPGGHAKNTSEGRTSSTLRLTRLKAAICSEHGDYFRPNG
jgi:hypothetical protein